MRFEASVRSEEVRALYAQSGPVLLANVAVASLVTATLWQTTPRWQLLGWFAALLLLSAARVALLRRFRLAAPAAPEATWGRRFVSGSFVSGLLWGGAGALFFDSNSALAQALLTFAIGGMVAAAAGTLACHLPAFFAFFAPALLPLAVRAFAEGDRMHLGLGALVLAYAVFMQRVARNNHRAFARAFRLANENAGLVARLEQSQVELLEANRGLEQRVAERSAELARQSEALQAAQRLEVAGRLAGGLAHDFNGLLTVVLNNSTLIKESRGLDEQARAAAEETLEAARRGAALIRQMLAFSVRNRTQPRVFDLNQLLGEWAGIVPHLLGDDVRVEVELWPEPLLVRADSAQIEQVLVNLVSGVRAVLPTGGALQLGARTATPPDGALLPAGRYVELSVGQAGAAASLLELRGVDAEQEGELDPLRRHLGLSTVRAIVEHWEGRLLISRSASTSGFKVFLPLASEPVSLTHDKRAERPSSARGATILVVDDEATLRSVMRRCLVREGFEVLVAADGPRALELARAHGAEIDLLLTDVMMPGLSGVELAKRLVAERPDLLVLFVSGYTFDEAMPAIDAARGTAFLAKPFDTRVLADKVHELLAAKPRRARSGARALSVVKTPAESTG